MMNDYTLHTKHINILTYTHTYTHTYMYALSKFNLNVLDGKEVEYLNAVVNP